MALKIKSKNRPAAAALPCATQTGTDGWRMAQACATGRDARLHWQRRSAAD
jgi:hypothetical protein